LGLRHRLRQTGQQNQGCGENSAPEGHLETHKNLHLPHIDLHLFTFAAKKLPYLYLSISWAKSAYLYEDKIKFLFSPRKSCRIIGLVSFLLGKAVGS
jgi:hypothetical protein